MTDKEAIENTDKVWVIKNGDYSVVEVYKEDIVLFTQFFDTKEEAEEYATFLKKNEVARAKAEEEIKGKMSDKEAVKVIKSIVETMDDFGFYTIEDKEAFRLAIEALEREETCENLNSYEDCDVFACSACGSTNNGKHKYNYCPNCGRKVEK